MWLYGELVARSMAALCAERELWKMMSPSRRGSAARAVKAKIAPRRNAHAAVGFTALSCAMHFLLFYTYVPDVLEKRPAFRGAHLGHARAAQARGELRLAGAFADPVDGAALFFEAASKTVVEQFARDDPYVTGGLVTRWVVREWTTVVGDNPAHPLPPGL